MWGELEEGVRKMNNITMTTNEWLVQKSFETVRKNDGNQSWIIPLEMWYV